MNRVGASLGFCIALSNFLSPLCSHFQIGLSQLITEEFRHISAKICEFFSGMEVCQI